MTVETFSTLAQTTLNGAINNAVGALVATANASFPQGGQFRIGVEPGTANFELMLVTAGAGTNNWTVTRGIEGTGAVAHGDGSQIVGILTAGAMQRALARPDLQAGVLASGDAALTINSTTQVTIAAAEQVYVSTAAGLLLPVSIVSTVLSGIAAPVTNPRLDMIVVDSNGVVTRVAGAETAGATISNRNGHGAVPAGSQLLHDLLVTVAGGVTAANTRDRRPWARGGYSRLIRIANASAGNDYSTTSAGLAAIDGTNLAVRMECSGVPIRCGLRGRWQITSGVYGIAGFAIDGSAVDSSASPYGGESYGTAGEPPLSATWDTVPAAGSHIIQPMYGGGTSVVILCRATIPLVFTVEEIARPNANNGTA